jgi:TPR repeat protein
MLGSLYYGGQRVSRNLEYSATLLQQSRTAGFTGGCGKLGESYLLGEGVPKDMVKARQILENAAMRAMGRGVSTLASCTARESRRRKMNPSPGRVSTKGAACAIRKLVRR